MATKCKDNQNSDKCFLLYAHHHTYISWNLYHLCSTKKIPQMWKYEIIKITFQRLKSAARLAYIFKLYPLVFSILNFLWTSWSCSASLTEACKTLNVEWDSKQIFFNYQNINRIKICSKWILFWFHFCFSKHFNSTLEVWL